MVVVDNDFVDEVMLAGEEEEEEEEEEISSNKCWLGFDTTGSAARRTTLARMEVVAVCKISL
jgi:hypothetical protein